MDGNNGGITLANGLGLYLEDHGKGQPIILIPGWAYTTEVFAANIPALADRFRTIAYDPRSHGRTEVTADGNDYAQHGRDLHQLIEALDLTEVTLIGWSLGAYDALAYIQQFGLGRITALAIIDESPKIIKSADNDWGEGTAEEVHGLVASVNSEAYLDVFRDYMRHGFEGDAPDDQVELFTRYADVMSPSLAAGLLLDATRYDFRKLLSKIDQEIPVLQVLRKDWSEPALRWVAENQPNAQAHVLGAHLMLMEYPEQFNDILLKFLHRVHTTG